MSTSFVRDSETDFFAACLPHLKRLEQKLDRRAEGMRRLTKAFETLRVQDAEEAMPDVLKPHEAVLKHPGGAVIRIQGGTRGDCEAKLKIALAKAQANGYTLWNEAGCTLCVREKSCSCHDKGQRCNCPT